MNNKNLSVFYLTYQFFNQFPKLITTIILSILLLIINNSTLNNLLSNKIIDISYPIINSFSYLNTRFINLSKISAYFNLNSENILLKQQNSLLFYENLLLRQLKTENLELKKILKVVDKSLNNINYLNVKIATINTTPFQHQAIILAGSQHGIKKNQVVISNNNLIGKIIQVSKQTAIVLLTSDLNFKVPVIGQLSLKRVIAGGSNLNYLKINYPNKDYKLIVNETVLTTGDGQFFPPDIIVGIVKLNKNELIIKPCINFNNLTYVQVISELDN